MHTLRHILPVLIAFTFGAVINEVSNLREQRADTEIHNLDMQVLSQEIADLRVDIEINYYDGYRHGVLESNIEEDEAGWDCRTMGNRICGVTAQTVSGYSTSQHAPSGHTVSGLTE